MNKWTRFKVVGFSVFLMLFVYLCSLEVPIGWHTYVLSLPAIVMICVSALAHVADIHHQNIGSYWDVRRNGTILAGLYGVLMLFGPLISTFPTWRETVGLWAFALIWITAPGQPTWLSFVWRDINREAPHNPSTSRPSPRVH